MIIKIYSVHCDSCNEWAGEEENASSARASAKNQGYKYIKVVNGSMRDFCPKCYQAYRDTINAK